MSTPNLKSIHKLVENGDSKQAKILLKEYLQQKPSDAEAWYLVARVSSSDEQKRNALQRALRYEPNHKQAKRLLSEIETDTIPSPKSPLGVVGLTRQQLSIGGIILLVSVLFSCILGFVIGQLAVQNSDNESPSLVVVVTAEPPTKDPAIQQFEETRAAMAQTFPFQTATQAVINFTETAISGTATQAAIVSPTASPLPTSSLPTLPPTPTNTSVPRATESSTMGTRSNPYRYSRRDEYTFGPVGDSGLAVIGVVRGMDDVVLNWNMFNGDPGTNEEWVLVILSAVCGLDVNEICDYSIFDFQLVGEQGRIYDTEIISGGDDEFPDQILGGDSQGGWLAYKVRKSDRNFMLMYTPNMFSNENYYFEVVEISLDDI